MALTHILLFLYLMPTPCLFISQLLSLLGTSIVLVSGIQCCLWFCQNLSRSLNKTNSNLSSFYFKNSLWNIIKGNALALARHMGLISSIPDSLPSNSRSGVILSTYPGVSPEATRCDSKTKILNEFTLEAKINSLAWYIKPLSSDTYQYNQLVPLSTSYILVSLYSLYQSIFDIYTHWYIYINVNIHQYIYYIKVYSVILYFLRNN